MCICSCNKRVICQSCAASVVSHTHLKHAGDVLRAGEEFLPRRILLADVDRGKWEGGLLMDIKTRDKEEVIDLATRKQDWNKMCREVCGPRDCLEEHKKSKRKKEREMEAKCQETHLCKQYEHNNSHLKIILDNTIFVWLSWFEISWLFWF